MIPIQYISDIHLEFRHIEEIKSIIRKIDPVCPILILAGDIGNPFYQGYRLFLEEMSKKFEKIFLISGNHEYYGGKSIEETEIQIRNISDKYNNISYLQKSYEDYKGIRFIGTTLWSNVNDPTYKINDTKSIKDMSVEMYNKLHQDSVDFLTKTLEEMSDIKCSIITHHLPSYKLIDKEFLDPKVSMYNQWFAGSLDDIMISHQDNIIGWFYGHTHRASDTVINNINTYCNPVGYKGENRSINYNKYIIL